MHLPPVPRFLARAGIRIVLVAVFLGIPGAVLYFRDVGIGFGVKEEIARALSGAEFQTAIGRLSLDPFRGLVARDVRVHDRTGRNLARVERVVVSLNWSELFARRLSVDFIELDDSHISIPLGPDGPRLDISGVTAECLFLPGQVRISSFEGEVAGVRVALSGLLRNPQAVPIQPQAAASDDSRRYDVVRDGLAFLDTLRFPGARPEIRVVLSGDLANPGSIEVVPISFRSGPIVAPQWDVGSVVADAGYRDGVLTVERIQVTDAHGGRLFASGVWQDGAIDFDLLSTIAPEVFRNLLPAESPAREVIFGEAPEVQARGRATLENGTVAYAVTGSLRAENVTFRGVTAEMVSADFASRSGQFYARDAQVRMPDGEARADLLFLPDDFRLRLTNSIPPTSLLPLLPEKERLVVQQMKFAEPPHVELEMRGRSPALADLSGTGVLHLGRTAMRGVWIDRVQSRLEIGDRAVTYRDFTVAQGKATGRGTFVYDFGRRQVVLENIDSTMPPVDVLVWVDPKLAEAVRPYRFHKPPRVRGGGVIDLGDPRRNDLSLHVDAPDGLDYDLLHRTLVFGRTTADVTVAGTKVKVKVPTARLMEGEATVDASISIDPADPTFGADVALRRVNFAQLTKLYFDYDNSLGVGSGTFRFTARADDESNLRGQGSFRVEEGHVFAIPVLGPLSEIINKIIPGAGFQTARLATADFRVGDEKITTDNLVIEGAGFSLFGQGDIYFVADKLDLSVRINARGIPGIVLFPVSKLFEYVSIGSVSKPEWRPKIIPRFGE